MYLTRITDDIIKNDMSNFYIIVDSFISDSWEKFRITMDLNGITDDIPRKEMSYTNFAYEAYCLIKFKWYTYNMIEDRITVNRDFIDRIINNIRKSFKEGLMNGRTLNDFRQYLEAIYENQMENDYEKLSDSDSIYFKNCIDNLKVKNNKKCVIKKNDLLKSKE